MPRRPNTVPSYLHHKPTNQAYVRLPDGSGGRTVVYLGIFDSSASRSEYARILAELAAAPASLPPATRLASTTRTDITVNEVFLAFWSHAEVYYRRPDGGPTSAIDGFRAALRIGRALYGATRAHEFGPLALDAVRARMVKLGWARTTVNGRVGKLKLVFKWAASRELVPAAVCEGLRTLVGLSKGRTPAREMAPVSPVEDAVVDATLPFLNRHVRGLVEFERLTGCRPGEACRVRRCDIDTSGVVWVYRPTHHKTAWRGKTRIVAVGPKAQALLKEFFTPNPDDYLFSPRRAVEEVNAARAANRKTPLYPSHLRHNAARRKAKPRRAPRDRYTRVSYGQAVDRACDRAFPPTGDLAQFPKESAAKWWARLTAEQRDRVKAWRKAHRWHPNQLRHGYATKARKQFSLEHAGAALGHSKLSVTEVYAERDAGLAAAVAARIG
jgi:integrase